jgi:signal transduction histidine kinase
MLVAPSITVDMHLRDLSLRAKLLITGLGALLFVLGVGALASFRYWDREQFALTAEQALLAARALRPAVEGALAHGQIGTVREQLDALVSRPPARAYRIVSAQGLVLLASRRSEEGRQREGAQLPDPWDIPTEGQMVQGHGQSAAGAVIAFSGFGGPGGRALLEIELDTRRIDAAIRRGRTFGLALTLVLGLAYATVLGLMLEREIMAPLWQLRSALTRARAGEAGARAALGRRDELGRIGESVDALLATEENSRRLARTRGRKLVEQAGFAEVGALAAQVGHEIKRPLAGIKSAIELIAQEYAISDGERSLLSRIDEQLLQIDHTVHDLLSLARPVGLQLQPTQLSGVLNAALVRLAGAPGMEKITVTRAFSQSEPPLVADAARLEQAVVNLLVNAAEAMPDGGALRLATRSHSGGIELTVTDSGVGIPERNLDKILQPFFSTKPHGTGLGLPLVARIVAAHGGRLWVESEVGRGTTFHVDLPVAPPPPAGAA